MKQSQSPVDRCITEVGLNSCYLLFFSIGLKPWSGEKLYLPVLKDGASKLKCPGTSRDRQQLFIRIIFYLAFVIEDHRCTILLRVGRPVRQFFVVRISCLCKIDPGAALFIS